MKTISFIKSLFIGIIVFVGTPFLLSAQSFTASIFVYGNNQCANSFIELIAGPDDVQMYTYDWTCPGGNCPGGSNTVSSFGFISNNDLSQSGIYTVRITEMISGDTASASVNVVIRPIPVVIISYDNNVGCAGTPMNVTANDFANGSNQYGPYSYSWGNGVGTSQVFSTIIGASIYPFSYDVVVTNSYGCTAINQNGFMVIGSPVPVISIATGSPTMFCYGGSAALAATVDYDTSLITLQWKKYGNLLSNTDHINYNATATGRYRCIASIDQSGCSSVSNYIDITSFALPQVNISPTGPLGACPNVTLTLEALSPTAVSYQWKKYANNISGSTYDTLQTTKAGKYKVIVEDANGCSRSSAAVEILPPPSNQVSVSGPLTICQGDSVTFTAAPNLFYQWKKYGNPLVGETMQTFTAKTAGKYRVVVSNIFNCTVASKQYEVVVVGCPERISSSRMESGYLSVYPNPMVDEIHVALSKEFEAEATIYIYDMTGRSILEELHLFESGNSVSVLIPEMKPGTYLLKVESEDFSFRKVMLKQ